MIRKIASGAEAVILKEKEHVIKDRIKKSYRIKEIDLKLRKTRTRKEAKLIKKLNLINFPVPKFISLDDQDMKIFMQYIKGDKLSNILENTDHITICSRIGLLMKTMHENDIIHGDLTTSNMILTKDNKLYFIDFGLGFVSTKTEDKAVDLHLIRQAFDSKHYRIAEKCFNAVLKAYKDRSVIKRLEKVELRGRNKQKKL